MAAQFRIEIEDVGGRFASLDKRAMKSLRKHLGAAVAKTTAHVADEMFDNAPPRSEVPPHVKDAIDYVVRGLVGRAGILHGEEPAGNDATQGEVAVFNEFSPNKQPFMRPAAEKEVPLYRKRAEDALGKMERELAVGGL